MKTRHMLILLALLLLIVASGCQQRGGARQQRQTSVAKEAPTTTGPEKVTPGTSTGMSADERAVNEALAAIGGTDSYFDDPALSTFDEDLVGF